MDEAAIWSIVDRLQKKPTIKKLINNHICNECQSTKVISKEGLPTCSNCGLVDNIFIDENPEWTSGISEDGKVNRPWKQEEIEQIINIFKGDMKDYGNNQFTKKVKTCDGKV